jgi:transcriptional regulator GlxA family with amidase domain
VRRHAFEPLSTAKILQDLKISRNTLQNWFSEHLGHSVRTEILITRIKRIQELLLTTDESLESIAHQCGFSHVVSMFRVFKKHVGLTPGEYRRREKVRM